MAKFRSILLAAACLAVVGEPFVSAQALPYKITTYQGNGQIACTACYLIPPYLSFFQPLVAQVVDANGVPVVGTTVNWTIGAGYNNGVSVAQSNTDTNGRATTYYDVGSGTSGSGAIPFISGQVDAYAIASPNSPPAVFYETQILGQAPQGLFNTAYSITPEAAISGPAGSPASPIQIVVRDPSAGGVTGVEVRLVSSQSNPNVSCALGSSGMAGGDPGTVLTDSTGSATCIPIPSGSGSGYYLVLVGGVPDNPSAAPVCGESNADGGGAAALFSSHSCLALTVSAPTPGAISITSGNSQTATAGQTLASPLVATLTDTNGNPLAGQAVTWSISPSTAGTLVAASTQSGTNGQVQTGVTLSNSASGSVQVTVSLAGNSNIRNTFSLTAVPLVQITLLQKLPGGDGQTAVAGQPFVNPLIVQASNSAGQLATGVTVNFSLTGPATLSTTSAVTNSAGQAQTTVTAGVTSTQATVLVTASIGSLTQTFQLTVIPPGPSLTATSFVNGADQKVGSLSPCSIATVIGSGVAPSTQGTLVGASFGPGPLTLGGASLSFGGVQAPIFSVSNSNGAQSATFQVPCEISPSGGTPAIVTVGGGTAQINVPILAASPGIYGATGTDGVVRAILVRQDGSFVSLLNPARRGETVTAFVTGLGPTTPPVGGTNQVPPRGVTASVNGTVVPGVSGGGATLNSAQLTPDLVGVYAVSFVVPANISPGNNVGFSIGLIPVGASTAIYSNLIYIAVQ